MLWLPGPLLLCVEARKSSESALDLRLAHLKLILRLSCRSLLFLLLTFCWFA